MQAQSTRATDKRRPGGGNTATLRSEARFSSSPGPGTELRELHCSGVVGSGASSQTKLT